jgi:uncharacterized membrane protein
MKIQASHSGKIFSVRLVYILLLLLVVGAAIRFYKLDYAGLWLDEIFSMEESDPGFSLATVYSSIQKDQPPVFFFLLHGYLKWFGYTDFAGRSLSCILGVLGILAMFFLGNEFKDERLGLLAAFLTTINYFHVGISVEIRFYALVFLLSALSYLFFLRAIKRTRIIDFVCYSVVTALALNTHYFGLVMFASQLLIFAIVLIWFKKDLKLFIGGLIAGIAAGLSLLHWLPILTEDLKTTTFHIEPLTLRYVLKSFWWFVYDPAAFILYLAFGGLMVRVLYTKLVTKKLGIDDIVLLGWLVIGFAIPLLYSIFRMPLFATKYCTIQLPAIFLMVALGLHSIESKKVQVYSVIIFVVSSFVVIFLARPHYKKSWSENASELPLMYFTINQADSKLKREDWREVAEFFASNNKGERVIFAQLASLHAYYFKKYNIDPPVDHNYVDVNDRIQNKNEVWLLIHKYYKSRSPQEFVNFLPAHEELINRDFEFSDSVSFGMSKAVLYKRKDSSRIN